MAELNEETVEFLKENQNARIVFTNGCFDILHLGHVEYLNEARALGDKLVIAINSDRSVRELKGPDRPINNESDRARMLLNLKAVDWVVVFDEATPLEIIKLISPAILVKGGDWKPSQIVGSDYVIKNGGSVKSLTFKDGYSTSNLIKNVQGKK